MYLTKPARVALQLLGGGSLVIGLMSLLTYHMGIGTIFTLVGCVMIVLGRQTKKPD
jgi:hypothetical protein